MPSSSRARSELGARRPVPSGIAACRAVLFDFGGTLDADGLTWKDRMRQLYADEGHPVPADRFDRVFYDADDALVGAIGARATLADTASRLAASVHAGLGLPDGDTPARVAARFTALAHASLQRNTLLLESLARRYRLGIVSNFYGNLRAVCEDAGIARLFGAVVDSTDAGACKPDPRIFRSALAALGVEPAEAVFVGDSLQRDMTGARALGMPHVWLAGPGAAGQACCTGDPVIRTLPALEALLA